MSIERYKSIIKNDVQSLEYNEEKHYFRLPSRSGGNIYEIMRSSELTQDQRLRKILAAIICDEEGNHIFNCEDEEHLKIIDALPTVLAGLFIQSFNDCYLKKK